MNYYAIQIQNPDSFVWSTLSKSTDRSFVDKAFSQEIIERGHLNIRFVKLGPPPDYIVREVLGYHDSKTTT
jgi:hypothetical protein